MNRDSEGEGKQSKIKLHAEMNEGPEATSDSEMR
jgi:hypothetical protein